MEKKSFRKNDLLISTIDTSGLMFQFNFSESPIKGLEELDFFLAGGHFFIIKRQLIKS